jgi:hypothetical protein
MEGKVFASTDSRQLLLSKFGLTASSLSKILNFESNSLLARKVRCYAVNFLKSAIWMDERRFI